MYGYFADDALGLGLAVLGLVGLLVLDYRKELVDGLGNGLGFVACRLG